MNGKFVGVDNDICVGNIHSLIKNSTGSYQIETIIEDVYFLRNYQISKEYMKVSSIEFFNEDLFF